MFTGLGHFEYHTYIKHPSQLLDQENVCVCVCVWERERESMYTETILEFIFTTFSENAFYVRHFKINIEFLLF